MKNNMRFFVLLVGMSSSLLGHASDNEYVLHKQERVRIRNCLSMTNPLDPHANPARVRGVDVISVSSNDALNSPRYVLESLSECYAKMHYPPFELSIAQKRLRLLFRQNHPETVLSVMQIEESVLLSRGFETRPIQQ